MDHQQVGFLDAGGAFGGNAEVDVVVAQHFADASAAAAGQGNDAHIGIVGGLDGLDHVARIARGGNGQEDVAGVAQGPHLLGEHLVEGIVVGDGGEDGAIHRQGDGGQFLPFGFEAADQFGGEVLGVGG